MTWQSYSTHTTLSAPPPCPEREETLCRCPSPVLYPSLWFLTGLFWILHVIGLFVRQWLLRFLSTFLANHSSGALSDFLSSRSIYVLDDLIHFCWNFPEVLQLCDGLCPSFHSRYTPVSLSNPNTKNMKTSRHKQHENINWFNFPWLTLSIHSYHWPTNTVKPLMDLNSFIT